MLCRKPFRVGVLEYGCGQCLPCRIDRRRLWAARLMLELRSHKAGIFLTLTYAPEFLPAGGTLVPKDLQDFLKRMRFHCPFKVRFYACGEYGERRGRPHYHLCLFGDDAMGMVAASEKAWTFGSAASVTSLSKRLDSHLLTWDLAWYIVGYICKRMTKMEDARLGNRHPEFARMSLRPGIGAKAMEVIAAELNSSVGAAVVARAGDVPYLLRMHGKTLPIGRYLVQKLRDVMGYPKETPEKVIRERAGKEFVELSVPGGLELRESRRLQHSRNADSRHRVNYLKRKQNEAF